MNESNKSTHLVGKRQRPHFIDIFQHKRVIIAELKFASPSHERIYHGSTEQHLSV